MPRRYPRLSANDHGGHVVSIPLSIAPRLFPHEKFISLPQKKVYEIAEANERLAVSTLSATEAGLPVKKRSEGSLTNTPSPTRVTGSCRTNSEVHDSSTEISVPGAGQKRSKRFWTAEEDEIVLCAVMMKEAGRSVVERLPHRSKSAVMQRFYRIKEKHEKALAEAEDSDFDSLDGDEEEKKEKEEGIGETEEGDIEEMETEVTAEEEVEVCDDDERNDFCEDEDMDEIPPL